MLALSAVLVALTGSPLGGSAALASARPAHTREVVVVDAGVPDYQRLVDDVRARRVEGRDLDVVVLDPRQDGIAQISRPRARQHDDPGAGVTRHSGNAIRHNEPCDVEVDSASTPNVESMSQFTASGGHVLGFGQCSIVVASLDHMLQVDLVGANLVTPVSRMPRRERMGVRRPLRRSPASPTPASGTA